ncbi:Minor tail protein OS=Streptomyces microflavus OX=1919 GN=Smic_48890 PE=4 SV=1 [Streptomyces microflavus]
MGVNIRKDGVLVVAADEIRSATVGSKAMTSVSATHRVTGLQPGAAYTAVSAYVTSATSSRGWFDNRFIRVDPVL